MTGEDTKITRHNPYPKEAFHLVWDTDLQKGLQCYIVCAIINKQYRRHD